MKPVWLRVQGFRSFKIRQRLRFPTGSGLHLLLGKNLKEPRLGGNGAGKSSLFDALCWCLYGKTSRGLKGPDVKNWEDEDLCQVDLHFRHFGQVCTLSRTHAPNSLTLVTAGVERPVSQEEVGALAGLDYDAFLACCLMGQFARFFLDLSPSEKLQRFSSVLQLQHWEDMAQRARRNYEGLTLEIQDAQNRLSDLNGRLAEVVRQAENLDSKAKEYAGVAREKRLELWWELKALKPRAYDAEEAYEKADRRLRRANGEHEELERQAGKLDALHRGRQQEHRDSEREVAQARRELDDCVKGNCPTCNRPVPFNKSRHKEAGEHLAQLTTRQAFLDQALREDKRKLHECLDALDALDAGLKDLRREHAHLTREAEALCAREGEIRRQRRALYEQENPYQQQALDAHARADGLRREAYALAQGASALRTRADLSRRWVRLFRELRLWLVRDALVQLEVESNNALQELGLEGWTLRCELEKVGKGGKVTPGFTVYVSSPTSKKPVRWEAWAGGETQRLRVAGAAGLAALVRSRSPSHAPKIEVWDEPTNFLSTDGIDDLLRYLSGRAEGRQVWLIDHRSLKAGEFASTTRVIRKRRGGSIIRQDKVGGELERRRH